MKFLGGALAVFFLLGCEAHTPQIPQKLESFIPVEESQRVYPESFDFVDNHFPGDCDWKVLTRVVDGDTIIVEEEERVRFIGIDTPESKDARKPLQKGALQASQKTKDFLSPGEEVCLIYDPQGDQRDTYDRLLAYVFTSEGQDVNAELLLSGVARGYFYFPFSRRLEFEAYQQKARDAKVGLWE